MAGICMNCFRIKGEYEVCPYCGYVEGTPPAQAYHLVPGTILENRYIVGVCIGCGGFGIIYRAFDTVLNIQVAIKEFYPSGLVNRAPGDTKVGVFSGEKQAEFKLQMERFSDEAKNMALFSRERDIVNVFHHFKANGTAYTVMEYIDKPLLKTWIKENGRMEVKDAAEYMKSILTALEKLHAHGIVHKDVSPDNIFMMGDGKIKLFDFGAAWFPDGQQEKTFSVVIKSGYAPPEQYRSGYRPGAFMDTYAAGAVFYEMVTGIRPSEGTDRAIEDDLVFPSKLGIVMDANLEKIIMKSLSVKPQHRFQTAAEFCEYIDKNTQVILPEEEMKRRMKKKTRLVGAVAVGGAAAAILLIAGVTWWMGKDKLHANTIKEDTVTVWLVSENDAEESGEVSDIVSSLEESFSENCPDVTLDITEIPEDTYADRIQEAVENNSLPDVFCTDYLENGAKDVCGEIDKLYHTMDLENYQYFEALPQEEAYEIPTGLQVALAYENYDKFQSAGADMDLFLEQETIDKLDPASVTFSGGNAEFASEESAVCVLLGDLSDYPAVSEVTLQATPVRQIQIVPVLDENRQLKASFCDYYGVNKDSSQNRQEAGMVVISCLLTSALQEKCYLDNYRALPVQTETLGKYKDLKLNGYLEPVGEYLSDLSVNADRGDGRDKFY